MIKAIVLAAALSLTSAGAATAQDAGRSQYETGYLAYVRGEYAEAVRWYRMAADQGYAKAQFELGEMYDQGKGVQSDCSETVRWYRMAADQGYAVAQRALGSMYARGRDCFLDDTPWDAAEEILLEAQARRIAEAVRLFQAAGRVSAGSAQDAGRSQYEAGYLALSRDELGDALRLFRAASDQGHAEAQFTLGDIYGTGVCDRATSRRCIQQNNDEAARWYRMAAAQGHAEAQFKLGEMYYEARGVRWDYTEAVRLFRAAADQGHADAHKALGWAYVYGRGVPQNRAEAVRLFQAAGILVPLSAQEAYETGVTLNDAGEGRVKIWFLAAAVQGHAEAQYRLGRLGGFEDDDEIWYRMAADQGHAQAQFALGDMYASHVPGRRVPQNDAEAVRWFRMAADQGHAYAQNSLGDMYANGRGVPQNYVEAYKWWALAAAQGDIIGDIAAAERDLVLGEMTPAQIAEGQRLVAAWRPR